MIPHKNHVLPFLLFFLTALTFSGEKKEFTLSELIHRGLKNNPLISARLKEIEARKAAYQAAKRLPNPEFEYHKGKGKAHDSVIKRNTEGFSLKQTLENPFKRHHRVQMYKESMNASEHSYNFAKIEIAFEIKNQFYKMLLLISKTELAQKNLNSIQEIHQLIKKRAEYGEVKQLDAIKLHVETLKAQNELNKIQTELKLAKDNLNRLLGNSLPSDFSVVGNLNYTPLSIEENTLLNKVFLTHPLIKEKEAELEQSKSNLSYVKWQRFPDFTLSGFSHKEIDGKNQGIGISLDIPLWSFKSKEIAEAKNLFLKEGAELKALKIELSTEIKSKLSQMKLSEQTLKLFHEGLLKQAKESLKISELSYKQGEVSLIDYLDSQRTYYSILRDYQESLYTWNVDRAALEKAIGEELK